VEQEWENVFIDQELVGLAGGEDMVLVLLARAVNRRESEVYLPSECFLVS
jgi:hypothetical protein